MTNTTKSILQGVFFLTYLCVSKLFQTFSDVSLVRNLKVSSPSIQPIVCPKTSNIKNLT